MTRAEEMRAAIEKLANTEMFMDLEDWNHVSCTFLSAADRLDDLSHHAEKLAEALDSVLNVQEGFHSMCHCLCCKIARRTLTAYRKGG